MSTYINFTTNIVSEKERFDFARDYVEVLLDLTPPEPCKKKFYLNVSSYLVGGVVLSNFSNSEINAFRGKKKIINDGIDYYTIQLLKRGYIKRTINGECSVVKAEAIIVYDESQPYEVRMSETEDIQLIIPRRLLADKLLFEDGHHGTIISVASPLGKLIANYLMTLSCVAKEIPEKKASTFINPIIDLVASALNGNDLNSQGGNARQGVLDAERNTLFIHIKNFIESNLHQEVLDIDLLVRELNLSRTHLYRTFNPSGGIASYIKNRRLQKGRLSLLATTQSVSTIAFSLGFKSASNFGRVFKEKFEVTPTEFREACSENLNQLNKPKAIGNLQFKDFLLNITNTLM